VKTTTPAKEVAGKRSRTFDGLFVGDV